MRRTLKALIGVIVVGATVVGVASAATSPSVITGGTSGVHQTSANLHGTVNPNGASTTYYFQFGLTTAYGTSGAMRSAGSGTTAVAASETASHLTPGTTYHYRLVATNKSGTSLGADRTFRTAGHQPPQVTTGSVAALSDSGATLTGTVNPSGQSTTWYFQWGNLGSLSQQTAAEALAAGSKTEPVASSLAGLLHPGTLYQYRLVAVHQGSAHSYGTTATFMTYPSRRPYAHVGARTRPRKTQRRPYLFTTSGTISGPSWIPARYACAGKVAVRFFMGNRRVRNKLVPVGPNCTFAAETVFQRLPRGRRVHAPLRLRVVVKFLSTAYLAPASARIEHVTLG